MIHFLTEGPYSLGYKPVPNKGQCAVQVPSDRIAASNVMIYIMSINTLFCFEFAVVSFTGIAS